MNKKWLWLGLGLLVVFFLTWYFWFRHYQDKQKFERIEVATEELANRVANKFGAEIEETRKYCSREARKFELEPLNCHIAKIFSANTSPAEKEVISFVADQKDLIEPTSISYIFKLTNEGAFCDINNANDSRVVSENFNIECSKRATASHYELIE